MRIIYITDFDMNGSGYYNISSNLALGLSKMGHDVIVLGLAYHNQEHNYPYSVIPARDFQQVMAMYQNLVRLWKPQVTIASMDIPIQNFLMDNLMKFGVPWIAITALESGPLSFSWAGKLMQANKLFFISQLGADEAVKAGLDAKHIQIGIDTMKWKRRTEDDRLSARKHILGIDDPETFVIFQVADNQERKNLAGAMEIVSKFGKVHPNYKYVLVTRPDNSKTVGWNLRDLAQTLGISQNYIEFDRGISHEQLWHLYAAADMFLMTSKGEGLCLPIMEAMAVGVPVVGNHAGAITELLDNERGQLIPSEYEITDPYGNAKRYFIDRDNASDMLSRLQECRECLDILSENAYKYIKTRTWDIPVIQLDEAIKELVHE